MNEKKIGKYLNKLRLCNSQKKLNIYDRKLKFYNQTDQIYQLDQYGGSSSDLIVMLDSYMNDIVNNRYRLLTDERLFQEPINCNISNDFFNEENAEKYTYDYHLKYSCFSKKINISDDYHYLQEIYKFKRSFSLGLTDFYVNDAVSVDDNGKIINFIHFSLEFALKAYIERAISNKIFGDKSHLLTDNVVLLYKGGNTTRMYINNLIATILPSLNNSQSSDNAREILNTIKKEYKIGDWDFLISINYDKLIDFSEGELDRLQNHIQQVTIVALTDLKYQLELLLKSKDNINRLSEKIQKFYFDQNMDEEIKKGIILLNKVTNNKKIEKLRINKVYTFDKIIDSNSIVPMTDEEMLNRKSFVYFHVPNSEYKINNDRYTDSKLVEVDKFEINYKYNKYLPNYLHDSMVYISFLRELILLRVLSLAMFHLFRCKINNIFEFEVKYLDSPFSIYKSRKFNVELIDVSIPLPADVRQKLALQFKYPNSSDLTTINIKSKSMLMETKIPSPQYMFADIAVILFCDALFVWEENKYDKRIKRLFYITLVCLINEKSIQYIHDIYSSAKQFFVSTNNLKTIRDRLNMLNTHFKISENPLKDKLNNLLEKSLKQQTIVKYVNHLQIKLKNNSPFKKLNFFEFLIEKYIEMLIIGEYILFNRSDYSEFCKDKLIVFFLVDHAEDYFNNNIIILVKGLKSIYKEINGSDIRLTSPPDGRPIDGLSPADNSHINAFMISLDKFEKNMIELTTTILSIIDALLNSGVNSLKLEYNFDTLF